MSTATIRLRSGRVHTYSDPDVDVPALTERLQRGVAAPDGRPSHFVGLHQGDGSATVTLAVAEIESIEVKP